MEKRLYKSRREILKLTGIGLLSTLVIKKTEGAETCKGEFKPFDEKTQIDIRKAIVEKTYEIGHKYEKTHGGCCRCTVAALQDAVEFIPKNKDVFRTACCLDGGATPTKIANCGAFTGSGIIIGYLCGTNAFGNTSLSHKLIREVYEKFKASYGSVLCKDVKEKGKGNCPEIVGMAAKWTIEIILRQFTNYSKEPIEK